MNNRKNMSNRFIQCFYTTLDEHSIKIIVSMHHTVDLSNSHYSIIMISYIYIYIIFTSYHIINVLHASFSLAHANRSIPSLWAPQTAVNVIGNALVSKATARDRNLGASSPRDSWKITGRLVGGFNPFEKH